MSRGFANLSALTVKQLLQSSRTYVGGVSHTPSVSSKAPATVSTRAGDALRDVQQLSDTEWPGCFLIASLKRYYCRVRLRKVFSLCKSSSLELWRQPTSLTEHHSVASTAKTRAPILNPTVPTTSKLFLQPSLHPRLPHSTTLRSVLPSFYITLCSCQLPLIPHPTALLNTISLNPPTGDYHGGHRDSA